MGQSPKPDPLTQDACPGPRLSWVDAAKGIGIFLVVVGHALRAMISSNIMASTQTTQFVDAWIYAFHMPLFFVWFNSIEVSDETMGGLRVG